MLSLVHINSKLALRNLIKHKVFSAVNIFGLAAALSVCLFLVNLIHTAFYLDHQHADVSRLYRIENVVNKKDQGDINQFATLPYPAISQLKTNIPDLELVCHITNKASAVFEINGQDLTISGLATEPAFFEMFNFQTLQGSIEDLFKDINSIAITEAVALRLFKNENPIGKVTKDQKVIRAVIESPVGTSHFQFEMVSALPKVTTSEVDAPPPFELSWTDTYSNYAYVKLGRQSDMATLSQRLESFSQSAQKLYDLENTYYDFRARLVKGMVFDEPSFNEIGLVMGREGLITFAIMIIVLMFIAGFNYTNLSVARAVQRTKEIGIRKVSGSSNAQIAGQVLAETLIFSFLGLLLGLGIYLYYSNDFIALLPFLSGLFNPKLSGSILLTFTAFAIIAGIIAGIFPALYFTRIKPLSLFNARVKTKGISLMWMRKALTTFQLTLSMFCVLFVTMLYKQAQFVKTVSHGIETEHRLILRTDAQKALLLKPLIEEIPQVMSSSIVSGIPGHSNNSKMAFRDLLNGDSTILVNFIFADENIDEVLEPKLIDGRFFRSALSTESNREALVNRKTLEALNIDFSEAVGSGITSTTANLTIVGVLDDIHTRDPFSTNETPIMIIASSNEANQGMLITHINEHEREKTLKKLEAAWNEINPDTRFEPQMLHVVLDKPVEEFMNFIKAQGFLSFAIIAISLLGQLGISLYNAETRVKEIGIRKVLGSKTSSIIGLLLKGTIIPLIIASLLASPIAFLLFQNGIANSMRSPLPIGPGIFIQCILLLSLLVTGVVISQTWRVANLNPTQSLRAE